MTYRFAIIGAGLTATSMLCQLVDRLVAMGASGNALCHALTIAVFEKEEIFGPGLPHSEKNVLSLHITNMCAQDMSVRADKPGQFYHWLLENMGRSERLPADLFSSVSKTNQAIKDCSHYPRALMGEYLKSQFSEAVAAAEKLGLAVELYPSCEVSDLHRRNGYLDLIVGSVNDPPEKTKHRADGVLLATGHWFEKSRRETYYASPWPAAMLLDSIPQSVDVAVMGSSLSAIETALTLSSDGHFMRKPCGALSFQPSQVSRRLILFSRRGLLPRVRGRCGRRRNKYLTCRKIKELIKAYPHAIELSMVFDLYRREILAAYGTAEDWREAVQPFSNAVELLRHDIRRAREGDGDDGELIWQTVLAEAFPVARELYLNLSDSQRQCFDEHYNTIFFMHVATQPLENAEKLLALMETGVVTVIGLGDDYQFEYNKKTRKYMITYKDGGGKKHHHSFKYVVNATGQSRSLQSDPSALTQNLIRRWLLPSQQDTRASAEHCSDALTKSLKIDPESHQVVMPATGNHASSEPPVFAVGPMVRGQIIDTSMALGLSKSTSQVAHRLLTILAERSNR